MSSPVHDRALVGGDWVGSRNVFSVINPADGSVIAAVPDLGPLEVRRALGAAAAAMPLWAARPAAERAEVLQRWRTLILQQQDSLARLLTSECGKPLAEAQAEIAYAASYVEWFAEECRRSYGEIIPTHRADQRLLVLRQPIGVCAAITPWNFPAAMVTRKIAPALAAGCAIVLKPAEQTPLTALALAALALDAGLPAALLSIVTGRDAAAIGLEMTTNPLVRKLSFTGSTAVGKLLMAQAASQVLKVSLELGGNAPFIVFDDADLDAAVGGAIAAKFRNAGQTCVCANRFYAQAGIHDEFVSRLAAAAAALRVGPGTGPVDMGPLIDAAAVAKVENHIADAMEKGANLVTGGRRSSLGGSFFEPTVIAGVRDEMIVAREETFGPVAAVLSFESEAEVVAAANESEFGLAAYFYTRDYARQWRVSEALQCGIVGANTGSISTATAPFGGWKESGLGREGSPHGILDYQELKYVAIGGL